MFIYNPRWMLESHIYHPYSLLLIIWFCLNPRVSESRWLWTSKKTCLQETTQDDQGRPTPSYQSFQPCKHTHTRTRTHTEASLVAQMVENLPARQEIWVWSLGGEDPLEKGMATHSSILAWRIPWTEEPCEVQSTGSQSQTRLRQLRTHALGLS